MHKEALLAALVDFHKAQCYFSSTMQITALLLDYQSTGTLDPLDSNATLLLATSGFLPIVLTLACIIRYGRSSWYLFILSLISFALAATTLGSYGDSASSGIEADLLHFDYVSTPSCAFLTSSPTDPALLHFCGKLPSDLHALDTLVLVSRRVWAMFANCLVWLAYCFWATIRDVTNEYKAFRRKYPAVATKLQTVGEYRLLALLYIIPWSACCAYQFYLFSIFISNSLISKTWTFGQIIAVTVWVPSVVEYGYILLSKSKCCLIYHITLLIRGTRWDRERVQVPISFSTTSDEGNRRGINRNGEFTSA